MSSDENEFIPTKCIEYDYEPNNDDNMLQVFLMSLLSGYIDENTDCNKFKVMSENGSLWKNVEKEFSAYGFKYDAQYLCRKWKDMVKCTRERKHMNKLDPKNEKYKMINLDLEIYYYFKELVNEGLLAVEEEQEAILNKNVLLNNDDVVIIKDDNNISDTMKNCVDINDDVIAVDTNNDVSLSNMLATTKEINLKNAENNINIKSTNDSSNIIKQTEIPTEFEERHKISNVSDGKENYLLKNNNDKVISGNEGKNEATISNPMAEEIVDVDEYSSEDDLALSTFVKKKREIKRKPPERLPDNHWTMWWKTYNFDKGARAPSKDDPDEIRRIKLRERNKETKLLKQLGKYKRKRRRRKKKWGTEEEIETKCDNIVSRSNSGSLSLEAVTEEAINECNESDTSDCVDLTKMEADIAANYLQTCILENFNNSIA